jgi:hypothetical protein
LGLLAPVTGGAQVAEWPSEQPPRPLQARAVTFPPYEIKTLANGLQVVVVQHHEQPVVTLRLLVRAGAAQDPPGKQGVAVMAAALLDQGAGQRSAAQIADAIDTIGGGLNTGAGSDLTITDVLVMKDSLAFGFDLMADVVRRPAFLPQELERQRQQALSGLRVNYEDPDFVASLVFDRLVYGFHPYGLPNSGTPESLAGITADDLRAFHKAWFVPNNALLGIVGDVSTAEALAAAEKDVGTARAGHYPTLSATASYGDDSRWGDSVLRGTPDQFSSFGSAGNGPTYGITLSVPIFSGFATQSRVRQALFQRDAVADQLEQEKRAIMRSTRGAFRNLISGTAEVEARRLAVVSAQAAYEAGEAGLEVGTRTIVDVLIAQQQLFLAKREYARSRHAYLVNLLRLRQAAGVLEPADLQLVNRYLVADADAALDSVDRE